MAETEKTGVESEAAGGIGLGPIFFIAHDRATGVGQLDPDLVAAPGFQGEFDQGSLGAGFEDPIKGDGMAGLRGFRTNGHVVGVGFVQIGLKLS